LFVVPKLLTLYSHHWRMGKKNKVVKLTPRKIRYIVRYKTNNCSTKSIAEDLKISESTVKRVWIHWIKTKMPLDIKKFMRKLI
jgi:DNA-binding NarL/FixJ family response regulator